MNEEFVPFELAKKLKGKGFKEKCLAYYDVEDNVGLLYNTQYTDEALPCQYTDLLQCHNTGEAETQSDDSGFCVDAPTISQVLKWLREDKGVYVNACTFADHKKGGYFWGCEVYDISEMPSIVRYKHSIFEKEDYKEAILAGIEYVLDNLI